MRRKENLTSVPAEDVDSPILPQLLRVSRGGCICRYVPPFTVLDFVLLLPWTDGTTVNLRSQSPSDTKLRNETTMVTRRSKIRRGEVWDGRSLGPGVESSRSIPRSFVSFPSTLDSDTRDVLSFLLDSPRGRALHHSLSPEWQGPPSFSFIGFPCFSQNCPVQGSLRV